MDKQECEMRLESFHHTPAQYTLVWKTQNGSVENSVVVVTTNLESFEYLGHTKRNCSSETNYKTSCAVVKFTFQTKLGFFFLQVSEIILLKISICVVLISMHFQKNIST